ncbi:MAG: hypothetical protein RIA69_05850 [Cyclobacteriaceae bacterium]
MEETFWESVNKLLGTVESSEYKHLVLAPISPKFVSNKFKARRKELIGDEDFWKSQNSTPRRMCFSYQQNPTGAISWSMPSKMKS